ncbi:MAG TPA: pyridoxal phosphate-dependent aminotransferase [Bryobacteraceae bacterium]|nr:pyridoxal phosphate-dependent aminotransferase [Bryobacteraceae bacterium]
MPFSARFHWNTKPNRLSEALARKRAEGVAILDLTQSNPTQAGFQYPMEIADAFADSSVLRYDPSPRGMRAAREAVSRYYCARGRMVSPERILLTASTSEAYSYLFKLLTNPGESVLVPRPSYPLFEYLATMESIAVQQYPLRYDEGWSIPVDEIPEGASALALVNPNNPTGSFLKAHELAQLARLGMPVICDEVFSDYGFGEDAKRVTTLVDFDEILSFSMSGLSKVAGLPQMKLGWIVINGPEAEAHDAMEKLEWIADTYLSVGAPVQCAAAKLLEVGEDIQRQIRTRTWSNLTHMREVLRGTAGGILKVEGGWYATVRMPRVRTEEEYALELLETNDVLVQPGYFYDFESEAYLVISLLTEEAVFRKGMTHVRAML